MQNAKDTSPTHIHLAVQNFGPIASADIDLRPLTVFVGQSNTGKTYLAALIYALHRTLHLPLEKGPLATAHASQVKSNFGNPEAFEAELKRCFNIESVSELIRFTAKSRCDEMQVTLKVREANQTCCAFHLRASELGIAVESSIDLPKQHELKETVSFLDVPSQAYFLPAGRRGLMQAHEGMTPAVKANGFSIDFLKQLHGNPKTHNGTSDAIRNIAKLLETEVLRGEIEMKLSGLKGYPEFFYRPKKASGVLRLSQSSSQVSELAPLALFVRNGVRPGDLLIIEEPEAHLHPSAQTAMALILARLIRAEVRVIVTTHSDWLLQQLGNLILEGELEKLGEPYNEHEKVLRREDVGAWLFQEHGTVAEIPFDIVGGVEPLEYGAIAEELYNHTVNLRSRYRKATGE